MLGAQHPVTVARSRPAREPALALPSPLNAPLVKAAKSGSNILNCNSNSADCPSALLGVRQYISALLALAGASSSNADAIEGDSLLRALRSLLTHSRASQSPEGRSFPSVASASLPGPFLGLVRLRLGRLVRRQEKVCSPSFANRCKQLQMRC